MLLGISSRGIDNPIFKLPLAGKLVEIVAMSYWFARNLKRPSDSNVIPSVLSELSSKILMANLQNNPRANRKIVIVSRHLLSSKFSGINFWLWILGYSLSQLGWEIHFVCQANKRKAFNTYSEKIVIHALVPRLNIIKMGDVPLTTSWTQIVEKFLASKFNESEKVVIVSTQASLESNFNVNHSFTHVIFLVTNHEMQANSQGRKITKRLKQISTIEKQMFLKPNTYFVADTRNLLNDYVAQMSISPPNKEKFSILSIPIPIVQINEKPIREKTLVFVGRRDKRKGADVLLKAWDVIEKELPDWSLIFVGPAGNDLELEKKLKISCPPRVVLEGALSEVDKYNLLATAGIVVIPSLYESFGITALEAMQMGAPIVSSNIGGLPEVVGTAGYLVTPGSVSDLAAALLHMAENENLRQELGETAAKRAREKFDFKKILDDYDHLFTELFNKEANLN